MHIMEEGFKETVIPLKSRDESSSVDYSNLPLTGQTFTEDSKRVGMVGIKIGMLPQWCQKRGERVLCTAIHFPSNEVISVVDPETWYRTNPVGKRKAYTRYGPMFKVTIGAGDLKSVLHMSPFDKVLMRRGINPKQHYGSFLVSEDGVIPPGTHLDVRHFNIGQFVNVAGRTIDWGFQGAMHRWGFRGQPDNRQVGSIFRSIGSKGDARVWPGKRLPGHMGHEWRQTSGLEILRINPLAQVIYVKGCVPGSHGYPVLVNDCLNEEKRVKDPAFPTFAPEEEENADLGQLSIGDLTSKDLYSEKLFQFNSSSIVFTEADEKKSAARDKTRAKIAKVKK
ncbi:hypothetical protein FO519_007348 [Halicephalobus sp. NKZ332]|nr:hypothetical protein FO519_007348 [Halicephalobus sp. NKZ332]